MRTRGSAHRAIPLATALVAAVGLLALSALAAPGWGAAQAHAAESVPGLEVSADGITYIADPAPSFDELLAPGGSTGTDLWVRNGSVVRAVLSLRLLTGVQSQLAEAGLLWFRADVVRGSVAEAIPAEGRELDAGAALKLRLTLGMSAEAGNEWQDARLPVGLALSMAEAVPVQPAQQVERPLALTGTSVAWGLLGAAMVAAGGALCTAWRRRMAQEQEEGGAGGGTAR